MAVIDRGQRWTHLQAGLTGRIPRAGVASRTYVRYDPTWRGMRSSSWRSSPTTSPSSISALSTTTGCTTSRSGSDRLGLVACHALAVWQGRGIWTSEQSRTSTGRLARAELLATRRQQRCDGPADSPACRTPWPPSASARCHPITSICSPTPAPWHPNAAPTTNQCSSPTARPTFRDAEHVVAYWKAHTDPDGHAAHAERAANTATAHASATLDGTVRLDANLDPIGDSIVRHEPRRLAEQIRLTDTRDGIMRSGAQRLATALVEMATRSACTPAGAQRPKPLFTAQVGDEITHPALRTDHRPGHVPRRTGPPHRHRTVGDGALRRAPTVVSVYRQRSFTGAVRRAIEVRDRHCHPSGCDVPTEHCDVDHIVRGPNHNAPTTATAAPSVRPTTATPTATTPTPVTPTRPTPHRPRRLPSPRPPVVLTPPPHQQPHRRRPRIRHDRQLSPTASLSLERAPAPVPDVQMACAGPVIEPSAGRRRPSPVDRCEHCAMVITFGRAGARAAGDPIGHGERRPAAGRHPQPDPCQRWSRTGRLHRRARGRRPHVWLGRRGRDQGARSSLARRRLGRRDAASPTLRRRSVDDRRRPRSAGCRRHRRDRRLDGHGLRRDRVVLDGAVGLGSASWVDDLDPPAPGPSVDPAEASHPAYSIDDVPVGRPLRPLGAYITAGAARRLSIDDLGQVRSHVPDDRLHPWFLAARMAPLRRHDFTYGPTIHVRTQIQHRGPAVPEQEIVVGRGSSRPTSATATGTTCSTGWWSAMAVRPGAPSWLASVTTRSSVRGAPTRRRRWPADRAPEPPAVRRGADLLRHGDDADTAVVHRPGGRDLRLVPFCPRDERLGLLEERRAERRQLVVDSF